MFKYLNISFLFKGNFIKILRFLEKISTIFAPLIRLKKREMNKKMLTLIAVAVLAFTACKKENTTTTDTEVKTEEVATEVKGDAYNVSVADSKIEWEGSKVVGGAHEGTITLQSGNLVVADGTTVVGGSLVFDMNSITVTDLTDAEKKSMLEGHLKGLGEDESKDHFFNVQTYPTANFEISKVTPVAGETDKFTVEGNLTMKGQTNPVSFVAEIKVAADTVSFEADEIVFDRTKWGVNYSSGSVVKDLAADKVIKDEIKLEAKLVAKK